MKGTYVVEGINEMDNHLWCCSFLDHSIGTQPLNQKSEMGHLIHHWEKDTLNFITLNHMSFSMIMHLSNKYEIRRFYRIHWISITKLDFELLYNEPEIMLGIGKDEMYWQTHAEWEIKHVALHIWQHPVI